MRKWSSVLMAVLVLGIFVSVYAYTPYAGTGERLADFAKQIAQPVGGVIVGWRGYHLLTDEHNRMKNLGAVIAGGALAGWDYTIAFVKWLMGIG